MSQFLEVLILSVVQGIAEFLPISSSGHLVVLNDTFTRYGFPLAADAGDFLKLSVLLHLGTLFAVLVVFRKRILALFGKEARLLPLLLVGTIPAAFFGLYVKKVHEDWTSNLLITGVGFLVTGTLLLLTVRKKDGEKNCDGLSYREAFVIGLFQAVAVLPGISRSGSTIVAGLFCGLKRSDAAAFSFLLAIPVIAGSALVEIVELARQPSAVQERVVVDVRQSPANTDAPAAEVLAAEIIATDSVDSVDSVPAISPLLLLLGMLVSFLVGLCALIWLLYWLQSGNLYLFAIWVFLLAPAPLLSGLHQLGATSGEAVVVLDTSKTSPRPTTDKEPETPIIDLGTLTPLPENDSTKRKPTKDSDRQPVPGVPLPGLPVPDAHSSAPEKETDKPDQPDEPGMSEEDASVISRMNEEERAAAQKEVERMITEERAAQDAQFARETAAPPLVPEPDKLVSLAPDMKLWITPDSKQLVMIGVVSLREGPLELFCCRRNSKEYESIIAIGVKPLLIHAGLIAIGAKPGQPVQYQPEFIPPTGETIEIRLRWKDEQGETRECLAQEWVAQSGETVDVPQADGNGVKKEPKAMETHWVFTGSMSYQDDEGLNHYIADETGELVGLSNFVGAILDVPIRSSDSNDSLLFEPYTSRIPKLGTAVTLILTPVREK